MLFSCNVFNFILDHSAKGKNNPRANDASVRRDALWSGTNKNRDVSTGPSIRSFARTAHSFACSGLLTSLTPLLVGQWMIRWLFFQIFFLFSTIVYGSVCFGLLVRTWSFHSSSAREWLSEQTSNRMSAAEPATKSSSMEQPNEWVTQFISPVS